MLLGLTLPRIIPQMTEGKIHVTLAAEGERLQVGSPLLEVSVDLSRVVPHDCPPVSHYRMILREAAMLRRLLVADGDIIAIGTRIAMLSTAEDPLEDEPGRDIRITIAGVVPQWQTRLW